MNIELTDYEKAVWNQLPKKQRERYLMKKYIRWYKTEISISQRDCHQRMNKWLIEQDADYKQKKVSQRYMNSGTSHLLNWI
ncbi:hypothetical protein [Priestia megaterium]|uniref:hypothetical protein n=1 Tax=Priestia megaterium TaxID=1404 RepID=UPI00301CC100